VKSTVLILLLYALDAAFKRIFWTAIHITNDELFPVYTCDGEFKQCHDTSIRLPSSWPFAFFDVCIFRIIKK
jgi:hypothetical protein